MGEKTNPSQQAVKRTPLAIYLGIASLIGLVGMIISFSIFVSTNVNKRLISEEEYLAQNHREIERCEQPILRDNNVDTPTEQTPQEIATCIDNAQTRLLNQRNSNYKMNSINTGIMLFVFIFVFIFHYRSFRKQD